MSNTATSNLNTRITALMAIAGLATIPEMAKAVGIKTGALYAALTADKEGSEVDQEVLAKIDAYEAANVQPEQADEAAAAVAPVKQPKKAREPKAAKAPKAPAADKPVVLPTEVGKSQFSTGGRMRVLDQEGTELGHRSVYGPRILADGSYAGHVVVSSRELMVTMPAGGDTWTVTGPKPVRAAAAPKPAAAPAAEATAPAATTEVRAAPKPGKKGARGKK